MLTTSKKKYHDFVHMLFDLNGYFYGAFDNESLATDHKKKIEQKWTKNGVKFNKDTIWVKRTKLHSQKPSGIRKLSPFK